MRREEHILPSPTRILAASAASISPWAVKGISVRPVCGRDGQMSWAQRGAQDGTNMTTAGGVRVKTVWEESVKRGGLTRLWTTRSGLWRG